MKPFSKILVPCDFSEHASAALEVAADMARRYEASVSLVHVHEPRLYSTPESFLLYRSDESPALMDALQQKLEAARQQLVSAGAMHADTHVRAGVVVTEIVKLAAEGGYDLIVMGTHGRTGVSHALIGSVAERVVRGAACPVLTVRTRASAARSAEA